MRALRPAAASMRKLPRHRRAVRPLLRILRPRDGAGRKAAAVVAPMVPGRPSTSRSWLGVWDSASTGAPLACFPLSPQGRGTGRGANKAPTDSTGVHTPRKNCADPNCDARTTDTPDAAADRPAATFRAPACTRFRPPVQASIAVLRCRAPRDRAPPRGTLEPAGCRRAVPRSGTCNGSLLRQTGRRPRREYAGRDNVESNRLKGPQHASHHIPKLDSNRRPPRLILTFQAEQARRSPAPEHTAGA